MHPLILVTRNALALYFRQPAALILTFLVPLVMMVVFGTVFGSLGGSDDAIEITLGVADMDHSQEAAKLIAALGTLEGVTLKADAPDPTDKSQRRPYTAESARAAITAGDLALALVIPAGFGRSVQTFEGGADETLVLLTDTSKPIAAGMMGGLIQRSLFTAFSSDFAANGFGYMASELNLPKPVANLIQGWFARNTQIFEDGMGQGGTDVDGNPTGPFALRQVDVLGEEEDNPIFAQQMAGVLTLFMLFSLTASGASLLRERDAGTLRRVLLTPVSPRIFLFGKYLAFFLIGLLQVWVMFTAGWLIFRVPIWQHLPALALFSTCTVLAATSFGLLLAALCKNQEQVSAISTMVILSMGAIGGSMMPRELMPPWLYQAGYFTFNGWAMQGFTDILWRQQAVSGIVLESGVMLGIALVFTTLATSLFSRRLLS